MKLMISLTGTTTRFLISSLSVVAIGYFFGLVISSLIFPVISNNEIVMAKDGGFSFLIKYGFAMLFLSVFVSRAQSIDTEIENLKRGKKE